jgi:hypothetical protein
VFGLNHEINYTPFTTFETARFDNECSWLAQPFLQVLKNDLKIKIIHLVRHPLAVINSLIGIDFWVAYKHTYYTRFIYEHLKGIEALTDPIQKSMFYYIYWNKPLEEEPRLRIEDFQNTPRLNMKDRAELTWDDLPQGKLKDELEEVKVRYGYV